MGDSTRAVERLHALVKLAIPICKIAERRHPRSGPGRPPEIPDWVMLVLITVALLKIRRNKSAQYRFLDQHRAELMRWIGTQRFPSRSTYCERYRRIHRLFRVAVRLQGELLMEKAIGDATCVAVDRSLVPALGPPWSRRLRMAGKLLSGVDRDSTWGYSKHHGWVQGYSYEVLVSAGRKGLVVPLLASVDLANRSEHRSFPEKFPICRPLRNMCWPTAVTTPTIMRTRSSGILPEDQRAAIFCARRSTVAASIDDLGNRITTVMPLAAESMRALGASPLFPNPASTSPLLTTHDRRRALP